MIFTLLILAIGGFLSPVLCKSSTNYYYPKPPKHFWPLENCVLEGAVKEEWEPFFTILDCEASESCEPILLETSPTIGKNLG